jgi:hypothetical protein
MMKNAIFTSKTGRLDENWSPIVLILLLQLLTIPKQLQLLTISTTLLITSIITYMTYMYIVHHISYTCTLITQVLYSYPIEITHGTNSAYLKSKGGSLFETTSKTIGGTLL